MRDKPWLCLRCGRLFISRMPHRCGSNYRKHHLNFTCLGMFDEPLRIGDVVYDFTTHRNIIITSLDNLDLDSLGPVILRPINGIIKINGGLSVVINRDLITVIDNGNVAGFRKNNKNYTHFHVLNKFLQELGYDISLYQIHQRNM